MEVSLLTSEVVVVIVGGAAREVQVCNTAVIPAPDQVEGGSDMKTEIAHLLGYVFSLLTERIL